ncbi:hypothetical protein SERLA73DRAFT_103056 [Serpula lacrymans var. lacrymans S7.3]|uniref:Zinc finger Mcm10/DnaG-type domain-containing protein n=1 Tax=Serpula lacrymans var. lacrymans (strain S7.3) TaxID=936435 RepID=F8PN17_SERL3|nr:hypothetical protein SERLA73DRAFT_103056 [Serpula lacrymans var. lacrymans S7.3]
MESSTLRTEQERQRQLELRRQIQNLKAQLKDFSKERTPPPASPKRKAPDSTLLAPATPSPKKRRVERKLKESATSKAQTTKSNTYIAYNKEPQRNQATVAEVDLRRSLAPSNVLNKLSFLSKDKDKDTLPNVAVRSTAFSDKPKTKVLPQPEVVSDMATECAPHKDSVPKRDDRLALLEEISIGPSEHKAPFDDPFFEQMEPNSGIRLSSRALSHEDLQEYLEGRCYLSPSRLYSSIQLLPNKQGYDVPVECDWITIAVVAERGPIRFSRAPVGIGHEGNDAVKGKQLNNSEKNGRPNWNKNRKDEKGKDKDEGPRGGGKKYVNMKLIDFGSRSSSSATGGKAVIRGDAFLSLLLFESDNFDRVTGENGQDRKIYKGGSRGAFEVMSKLKEGDVIALLNPKILKPFQRAADTPHPVNNILAVTPESADSIMSIGRARDLGMCKVLKRDGKVCGSWCDKRVSEVCDYHVQNAVERQRAGRAEFSIGTSGMSSSSFKRKPAYDPARQWGLKPDDSRTGDATYIVSGHIVNGSGNDTKSLYASENMGREGQAKAKRQLERDTDRELQALLKRDREGIRAVLRAREVGLQKEPDSQGTGKKGKGKAAGKSNGDKDDIEKQGSNSVDIPKTSYSAKIIKNLGFDPSTKPGQKRASGDDATQRKLQALAAIQSSRKDIRLDPRPGQRIRSCVIGMSSTTQPNSTNLSPAGNGMDYVSDDDVPHSSHVMIDLDGSDS